MIGNWIRRLTRRRAATPISVILWGKADCSLCDRAGQILDRIARDYPLRIEKRDITADPVDHERFRYVIPVVEIDGGQRFEGKITEYWLRQEIERLARQRVQ